MLRSVGEGREQFSPEGPEPQLPGALNWVFITAWAPVSIT